MKREQWTFSHRGLVLRSAEMGSGVGTTLVSTDSSILGILSTGKIENWFLLANGGVQFIRCGVKNPKFLLGQLLPLVLRLVVPVGVLRFLVVRRWTFLERQTGLGSLYQSVQSVYNGSTIMA